MIENVDRSKCYSCGACAKICPQDAIMMVENDRGFRYPIVDKKKCINCGLCDKSCQIGKTSRGECKGLYALVHKDEKVVEKSSSGGAFSAMAESVLKGGGVVVGAVLGGDFTVYHTLVEDYSQIQPMRRAKYVESNLKNVYAEALGVMKQGRKVLFSGTPCQVEGFHCFLEARNVNTDNVIFCMLVCHGVSSQRVWLEYIDYFQKTVGIAIENVNFRDKSDGWRKGKYTGTDSNGNKYDFNGYNSIYHLLYANRESCFNCEYTSVYRNADVTIGDFWPIDKFTDEYDGEKGISLVITHSEKGEKMVEKCKEDCMVRKFDFDPERDVLMPAFSHPYDKPIEYDSFWKDFQNKDMGYILKKYTGVSFVDRIKRKCRRIKLCIISPREC